MRESNQHVSLYEMIVDNKRRWCTLVEAARCWDSGFHRVEFGQDVIDDGWPRPMTEEEKGRICDLADEYSANE